jgi:ATP synthase protein I
MPEQNDQEKAMQDKALQNRLAALKHSLGHAVAEEEAEERKAAKSANTDGGALAAGLKASTELVAGVLVGGVMGYMLDQWLGTKPWLLMVFMIFGIAAGFRNLYRLGMKPTVTGEKPKEE